MPFTRRRVFRKRSKVSRAFRRRTFRRRTFSKRRTAIPATRQGNKQYATGMDTFDSDIIVANAIAANTISLSECPRLLAIADQYRFYRITKVEYTYTPNYNVAQVEDGAATEVLPTVWRIMDRTGNYNEGSLSSLQHEGVRPKVFNKTFKMSYKPNTLIQVINNTTVGDISVSSGQPQFNKWFPTHLNTAAPGPPPSPASINYYGHITYFNQDNATASASLGRRNIRVWAEFKDPYNISM